MADAGKKKKTKGTTVSLGSFLNESSETSQSWADVDDDAEETAPTEEYRQRGRDRDRNRDDYDGPRRERNDRNDRYDDYRRERRGDYQGDRQRDSGRRRQDQPQKPPPDQPPYIAYVGNLSFSVTEDDLGEFFSEHCKVNNVRILVDRATNRSKGYGYVQFEDRESLVIALEANGVDFESRPLRVDVAEGRPESDRTSSNERNRSTEKPLSRADLVDKWERGKRITPSPTTQKSSGAQRNYSNDRPARNTSNSEQRSAPRSSKPNPFGDAKPRDESLFQKKKEEEWKSRGVDTSGSTPVEKTTNRDNPPKGKVAPKNTAAPVESKNLYSVLKGADLQ